MATILRHLTVVIPFRRGSQRFADKAFCEVLGKTLIEHAVENARTISDRPPVLTAPQADLDFLKERITIEGVALVASSESCACATERLVEIAPRLPGDDLLLSLPIDEPAIKSEEIVKAIKNTRHTIDAQHALTFYCDFFTEADYRSPLSAKVVIDQQDKLLYMSRTVIPSTKSGSVDPAALKKNVGAFVFSRHFLARLAELKSQATSLDIVEGLEQLRWLELGLAVRCEKIAHVGFGVDVPEQVALLEERMRCR